MGSSSDAIVWWGYSFDSENQYPWHQDEDDSEDEDDRWRRLCGWDRTWSKDTSDVYFADRRAFADAHPVPCELVRYGYTDGYTCYGLALNGTRVNAFDYGSKELRLAEIDVEQATRTLHEYCEFMGIPIPKEAPTWHLASRYG